MLPSGMARVRRRQPRLLRALLVDAPARTEWSAAAPVSAVSRRVAQLLFRSTLSSLARVLALVRASRAGCGPAVSALLSQPTLLCARALLEAGHTHTHTRRHTAMPPIAMRNMHVPCLYLITMRSLRCVHSLSLSGRSAIAGVLLCRSHLGVMVSGAQWTRRVCAAAGRAAGGGLRDTPRRSTFSFSASRCARSRETSSIDRIRVSPASPRAAWRGGGVYAFLL